MRRKGTTSHHASPATFCYVLHPKPSRRPGVSGGTLLRPGLIGFKFDKTGACELHEKGTASIQPCWWLGIETDENEAGEAVAVQQYVFRKNSRCTMYLRIDEDGWSQATVAVPPECRPGCRISGEPMHPSGGRSDAGNQGRRRSR
jgi:hypothetical protein